jgi:Uma2 family endonuclease
MPDMPPRLASLEMDRGSRLYLEGVDWAGYLYYLKLFAESPAVRLTYDRGALEIMSPLFQHDFDSRIVSHLVTILTQERGLPLVQGGATTLRRKLRRRGLEADESFWIANAHRMAGVRDLDLRTDPPPDLAFEVEVSRRVLKRLPIYAALRVPELWVLRNDKLTFRVLSGKSYRIVKWSPIFPKVPAALIEEFVLRAQTAGDQNPLLREFRERVRQIDRGG